MTRPDRPAIVLHIARSSAWDAAKSTGCYVADSLSTEGFIHCSRVEQLLRVAHERFVGAEGLVLLAIDVERLAAELRYENLAGGDEPFPHVYGAIETAAVVRVWPFRPSAEGRFELPADLGEDPSETG